MKRSNAKGPQRWKAGSFKTYGLEQSPFFRVERRCDLARLLRLTPETLFRLIANRQALYATRETTVGTKTRSLAVPLRDPEALPSTHL